MIASALIASLLVTAAPTDIDDPCLPLVAAHKKDDAAICYRERARMSADADAMLARELADLVGTLELREPDKLSSANANVSLGKIELAATSTLAGAYAGVVAVSSVVAATSSSGQGAANGALLLSPVIGGAIGIAAGAGSVVLWREMTEGDANLMRAFIVLGAFNASVFPFNLDVITNTGSFNSGSQASLTFVGMGANILVATAAGAVVAVFTDLDEGVGSVALSTGLWTGVTSLFVANMFNTFKGNEDAGVVLATAAANAGFVAGILLPSVLPMTRAETWAIDVGGGIGLLAGGSLAVFSRAPNPVIGWGTIATGTAAGLVGGFFAARLVPPFLESLPSIVAVRPIVFPDPDDVTRVAVGGALRAVF